MASFDPLLGQLVSHVHDPTRDINTIPRCSVYNSVAQTITTGGFATLNFNSEHKDTDNMHDTGSNTSRITIKYPGSYMLSVHVVFDVNGTGRRIVAIKKNGADFSGNSSEVMVNTNGGYTMFDYNRSFDFVVGDYLEVQVYHTKGSNLDVLGAASGDNQTTFFQLTWLGR